VISALEKETETLCKVENQAKVVLVAAIPVKMTRPAAVINVCFFLFTW
jgi:hypothetical protein